MKKFFILSAFVYLVLIGFFAILFNNNMKSIPMDSEFERPKNFIVEKGQGFKEIAANLEDQGFIESATSFKFYLLIRNWAGRLKPGSYEVQNQNAYQIARLLTGGLWKEATVVIVEGKTLAEIDQQLKEEGVLVSGKLEDLKAENFSSRFSFLNQLPKNSNLEGFLFPDTYRFLKNSSVEEIAEKMLFNFQEKIVNKFSGAIKKANLDFNKATIMASLLESEIPHFKDRPKVAGIIWKRLADKMPLQIDSTIVYYKCFVKKEEYPECRIVMASDLKEKSQYNTYLNIGLPKSAIANAGENAFAAILNPESSAYWFYLSDPKTGDTIFSRTLREHEAARKKYLK